MTENIRIVRDGWGVPHIHAETELGAIHGQGYAMAQDRLGSMMRAYRMAAGRMAEAFGRDWLEHDFEQRLFAHEKIARERYQQIPPFYQKASVAFLGGMQRFMEENPERVPAWAMDVEPYHLAALARFVVWEFIVRQVRRKLPGVHPEGDPKGSNQWAVRPGRTSDGHAILLIDPHVPWSEPIWQFHECHLHGGDLHAFGFQNPGLPYAALGHSAHAGWAFTVGGPDTGDIYELNLNPDHTSYRYDGTWLPVRREVFEIPVRIGDRLITEKREALYSHHGPILHIDGDKAYAARIARADNLLEDLTAHAGLNNARSVEDIREVLATGNLMPQNVMCADVHGHIYYQRTGQTPIRPPGYDWTGCVPGDTSATEWLGYHDPAELAQCLDPECGWMQNCNISPGTMFPGSPMTSDRYPAWIYNDQTRRTNPRGERARERLGASEKMTIEDALAIATNTYVHGERPWREALLTACCSRSPMAAQAASIIRGWDGHARQDSPGMTLFHRWWLALDAKRLLPKGAPLNPPTGIAPEALTSALEEAAEELISEFGRLDTPWGHVCRARRGEEDWAVDGVAGQAGLASLWAVKPGSADAAGVSFVEAGPSCTTVVVLDPGGVRSWSVVPHGQSEEPSSPHFTDQGRLLFAQRRLKETFFTPHPPEDAETQHVISWHPPTDRP